MTIWQLARKITMIWRQRGWAGVARAIRSLIYHRAIMLRFVADLGSWAPPPATIPNTVGVQTDIGVRPGTLDELALLRGRDRGDVLPLELHLNRVHGVSCFWLAWLDGELAGILWVFGPEDPAPFVRLQEDEREIRMVHVLRKFRGKGVATAMRKAALYSLKADGVRRVYAHVRTDNRAALKPPQRSGMHPIGLLETRRMLGVTTRRFTPFALPWSSAATTVGWTAGS